METCNLHYADERRIERVLGRGIVRAMIAELPVKSSALPHPAIALPIRRKTDLGAVRPAKEANSNTKSDTIYTPLLRTLCKLCHKQAGGRKRRSYKQNLPADVAT